MDKALTIQQKMRSEMLDKSIFDQASEYAHKYLDQATDRNVYPTEEALIGLKQFDEDMPQESTEASDILHHLNQYGAPNTVSQIGGRYFGFVNGGVVPAGLAAKNLSIFWDQNTAMQVISPISSKLESVVEKWLRQLFDLPSQTCAGYVSGTSSATFCGLAAARYRLLKGMDWDINAKGLFNAPGLRIVTSTHAHSTVIKAISLLGFGTDNIEWVECDDQGRIKPELMPALDSSTIVILQAGNVNNGSFDDFETICAKAREAGAWVHIDGAFGLWAACVQQLKYLTKGIEKANSWSVDGHKTLNTPYDSGIIMCSDREAMVSALHMSAGYIVLGEERDGMFYTPEMSRRARIIELWATLKYLGKEGIDEMILEMHDRAKQFAEELGKTDGYQVLNDVIFNQVIVQCETDELTERVISKIQELRKCWVGGSSWNQHKVIRISVCSWATTSQDVTESVESFKQALSEMEI